MGAESYVVVNRRLDCYDVHPDRSCLVQPFRYACRLSPMQAIFKPMYLGSRVPVICHVADRAAKGYRITVAAIAARSRPTCVEY